MTRQHYKAIAEALRQSRPDLAPAGSSKRLIRDRGEKYAQWNYTAVVIRGHIAGFNPKFDSARFDKAAGIA